MRVLGIAAAFILIVSTAAFGAEPYSYRVIDKRDTSLGTMSRMVYRLYLDTPTLPDPERMKATAQQVWQHGNRGWDDFTVFMVFGPIKDFSSGAYGIAKFNPAGISNFRISDMPPQILRFAKKNDESSISQSESVKHGNDTGWVDPQDLRVGQVVCNKFKLVTKLTGDTLHLAVDSDLADSTEVMVSVSRSYVEKGNKETYPVDYLNEKSTVGKWKSDHTVSIDSATWKRLLREQQELMSRFGKGFDVASISDKISVRMVVPVNQPDPRFGKWNSQLTGTAVRTSGLRVVKDEVEIPYPLDSPPVGKSPFPNLNPLELENNQTYIVSKRTPLMPSPNPPNPLAALRKMKYVPAGGSFEVLDKWEQKGGPWYRVRASDASGVVMGAGWINSGALLGQKLKAH